MNFKYINICKTAFHSVSRYILASFFFWVVSFSVSAQVIRETRAQVDNIDFYLEGDKVIISYDIVKGKDWEIFDIGVKIFEAADTSLVKAKTFSGDVKAVKPGKGKQIIWDIKNDLTYLDGNIFILLEAMPTNPKTIPYTSKTKAVIMSTVLPGWGSSKITLNAVHISKGIAAYTMVGLSIKYNLDARTNYDNYQDSEIAIERNNFFDLAESNYRTSRSLMLGAASIWAIDYAWILLSRNKTLPPALSATNLHLNLNTGNGALAPAICFTYNF